MKTARIPGTAPYPSVLALGLVPVSSVLEHASDLSHPLGADGWPMLGALPKGTI